MKQKVHLGNLRILLLASVMWATAQTALAQTTANKQTNKPADKVQYYKQQKAAAQKPQPVPMEQKIPLTDAKKTPPATLQPNTTKVSTIQLNQNQSK